MRIIKKKQIYSLETGVWVSVAILEFLKISVRVNDES